MMWLLWLLGCQPPQNAASPQRLRGEVLIAHTNDLHAHFRPVPNAENPTLPPLGGFEAIDAHIRALRAEAGDVLYLDGGDLLSGTPLMEHEEGGIAGGAMLSFLDAAHCDGWVVGNHEFDRGIAHAQAFVDASTVPVLTANVFDASGERPLFSNAQAARIVEHNGVRIGIFGLTTPALGRLTSQSTASRVSVVSLEEAAQAQVDALDPVTDLIVALTHAGVDADQTLAAAVDGIDLIVGGHSHSQVSPPIRVNETWIVQAGSYGQHLGLVRLTVEDDAVVDFTGKLIALDPSALPAAPSPAVTALVDRLGEWVDEAYGVTVAALPAAILRARGGESAMGRWAAEVVRLAADADVGAVNAGGLRADLAAGPVTRGDLYQVFPFSNEVVSVEISGSELLGLGLQMASQQMQGRAPLQMSGVELQWRTRMDAPEVVSVRVGGDPLVLDRTYVLATSSFLADQLTRRFSLSERPITHHEQMILDAAAEALTEGLLAPPSGATAVEVY